MSMQFSADSEDLEMVQRDLSVTHRPRVEKRLLRSLVGSYIQRHAISITSCLLAIIIIQQVVITYIAVRTKSCLVSIENLEERLSSPIVNAINPQYSSSPAPFFEPTLDKEHGCGYPNCDLTELTFKKLKSYARCQQCFDGLTVARVYSEYHGSDFGIEFAFKFGNHVQNWNDNDWLGFHNITSKFSGSFRLIQVGDDSTQYIQWYGLSVKS